MRELISLLALIVALPIGIVLIYFVPTYLLDQLGELGVFSAETVAMSKEKLDMFRGIAIVIFFITIITGILLMRREERLPRV